MAKSVSAPNAPAHTRIEPLWRALAIIVAIVVAGAGCGGSGGDVPADVAAQLDVPDETLAVLGDSSAERIPRIELREATVLADALDAELRIVVAGDGQDLVDAEAVADAYGGTVLSYKAGDVAFQAASTELETEQLNRATAAAGDERDMGASALAFVDVLEDEGPEFKSTSLTTVLLWVLFIVAALFVLWQALAYWRARKRAARRRRQFEERQRILADWADRLVPEIEQVAEQQGRLDATGRRTLDDTIAQVGAAREGIAGATSLGDLDANEIRIARSAMKLRSLRQLVG